MTAIALPSQTEAFNNFNLLSAILKVPHYQASMTLKLQIETCNEKLAPIYFGQASNFCNPMNLVKVI